MSWHCCSWSRTHPSDWRFPSSSVCPEQSCTDWPPVCARPSRPPGRFSSWWTAPGPSEWACARASAWPAGLTRSPGRVPTPPHRTVSGWCCTGWGSPWSSWRRRPCWGGCTYTVQSLSGHGEQTRRRYLSNCCWVIGGRTDLKLLLAGLPKETLGGVVTRELVMLAILWSGDPILAPAISPSRLGEWGKKGDLCWPSFTGSAGGVRLGGGFNTSRLISTSASPTSAFSWSEPRPGVMARPRSVCSFMAEAMALCCSRLNSSWYKLGGNIIQSVLRCEVRPLHLPQSLVEVPGRRSREWLHVMEERMAAQESTRLQKGRVGLGIEEWFVWCWTSSSSSCSTTSSPSTHQLSELQCKLLSVNSWHRLLRVISILKLKFILICPEALR